MKWKFKRSPTIEGIWEIQDEGLNVVCYFDKHLTELQLRIIENAPQMYELIKEVADTGNTRTYRPEETYQKFVDLMKKIND
jgi:hypothetical protein